MSNRINYFLIIPILFILILPTYLLVSSGNIGIAKSPEISIKSSSSNTSGKAIAASCAFGAHGGADEYTPCSVTCPSGQVVSGTSQCGGACSATCPAVPCTKTNACGQTVTGTVIGGVCTGGEPATCSKTNVCGQTFSGYQCPSGCTASNGSTDINSSCIKTFNTNVTSIKPNESVDFSWTLGDLPNDVGSRCGFVDLTTGTPRPIPGLQNLDPKINQVRINNIQNTTRFCLVCQFYSLLNNNTLGNAQVHQWIRVIRIGEN